MSVPVSTKLAYRGVSVQELRKQAAEAEKTAKSLLGGAVERTQRLADNGDNIILTFAPAKADQELTQPNG